MRNNVNRLILALAVAAAMLPGSPPASAQEYPTKNIELVVPFPAGSTTDVVMRLMLEPLSTILGKTIVPNYVTGGVGVAGTERIARQPPDGYTLGAASSTHPSLPYLQADFKLDPIKDFTAICMFGRQPIVALTNPAFPAKTIREFIAEVRANPGKYNYGIGGGQAELDFGSMVKLANLNMVGVRYRGGPQLITGVLGNEVHIMVTGLASAKPLMDAGKLRAIAISSGETFPGLSAAENLPLVSDEIPGYRGSSAWFGLMGPAGMPDAIVQKISDACSLALRSDAIKAKMKDMLILPASGSAKELRERIVADVENTKKQVQQTGITPR